jgi:hypothetical protein
MFPLVRTKNIQRKKPGELWSNVAALSVDVAWKALRDIVFATPYGGLPFFTGNS